MISTKWSQLIRGGRFSSRDLLFDDPAGPHKPSRHLFHKAKGDVREVLQNTLKLLSGKDRKMGLFHRLHIR